MGIAEVALVMAAIGAATTVASTVGQASAQKKAAAAQKSASETANAQQQNDIAEQRRQQVREQRIKTAQIQQSAQNQGSSDSSGQFGSLAALSTNAGNNLGILSGRSATAQAIGDYNQQAANAGQQAQTWQAVGSLGGAALQLSAGAAGRKLSGMFADSPVSADADVASKISGVK